MLFLQEYGRYFLLLHTVVAVATVAISTHLVVWMRPWRRGKWTRYRAVRRFAFLSLAFYGITFTMGNLIYPLYKVRVRTEFLEHPVEVARETRARRTHSAEVAQRYREINAGAPMEEPEVDLENVRQVAGTTARVARWFDVKEHWVALGFALAAACAFLLAFWNPARDGATAVPWAFAMACGAAASAWIAAIIGVVVSSFRAVGGL